MHTARRHRTWPELAGTGRSWPEPAGLGVDILLGSNPLLRARHQDDVSKASPNSLKLYIFIIYLYYILILFEGVRALPYSRHPGVLRAKKWGRILIKCPRISRQCAAPWACPASGALCSTSMFFYASLEMASPPPCPPSMDFCASLVATGAAKVPHRPEGWRPLNRCRVIGENNHP